MKSVQNIGWWPWLMAAAIMFAVICLLIQAKHRGAQKRNPGTVVMDEARARKIDSESAIERYAIEHPHGHPTPSGQKKP